MKRPIDVPWRPSVLHPTLVGCCDKKKRDSSLRNQLSEDNTYEKKACTFVIIWIVQVSSFAAMALSSALS